MLIRVGTVVRAHGLAGELKIRPETDDPSRFLDLPRIHIGADVEGARPFDVDAVRLQPTKHGITVLLDASGIDGRDHAERYRGFGVYAQEEDLPGLDEDEWFLDDLVGLTVVDLDGTDLGIVQGIVEIPAHPLLAVALSDGREGLIPAVSPILRSVDVQNATIEVDLPDGLLDP